MNRFAALDSDNEDEPPKVAPVTLDKKKKKDDATATVAASSTTSATKSADAAPSNKKDGKAKSTDVKKDAKSVPGQKVEKAKAVVEASSPEGVGEVEVSGSTKGDNKRDQRSYGKGPKTRYEKRQDENDPSIKPDNRIRGSAHGQNKRRPSKNADREEADGLAKEGEKFQGVDEATSWPAEEENSWPAPAENTEPVIELPVEEPVVEEVVPEPVPVTYTLEEYQRQREIARASSALLANAKAARAVEELTGFKIKEADTDAGVYTGAVKTSKTAKLPQRSTVKTVVADLGFKAESENTRPPREDRRTPSGRGGDRDRSGRGSGYANKSRGPIVDIADSSAFPSL